MNKFNILIVEDEEDDYLLLEKILRRIYGEYINEITIATSYELAVQALNQSNSYDISFLDIDLGGGHTSFQLIDLFGRARFRNLAFLTAAENIPKEMRIKASPISELDKPFNDEDIASFLSTASKRSDTNNSRGTYRLKTVDNTYLKLENSDILYIETAEDNYCKVFYLDKITKRVMTLLNRNTISNFEQILDSSIFVRCHASAIVNKDRVISYSKRSKGGILQTDIKIDNALLEVNYSETYIPELTEIGIIGETI
jgi:DNA-binding LytR/AlgR family response regulator